MKKIINHSVMASLTRHPITILIAIFCVNTNLCNANAEPQHITSLSECIDLALSNNLSLQSDRLSVEKAKTLQGTAFNIGKTNFAMSQDPTAGGSPDNSLSVSQSFEFPTVYFTRRNLLKAETEAEKSQLKWAENELIKDVKSAYYRLLYAQEHIRILQEQDGIYQRFVFLSTAKVLSGESNRLEQIQAERLLHENQLEIEKAETKLQNTQLLLQQLLNTNATVIPEASSLPILDPLPFSNTLNAIDNTLNIALTPLNQVYESRLQAEKKNVSLQKQGFLPDFTVALRNQFLLKGFNPYDIERERFAAGNFMGFEVGVAVPLFFGEQRAKVKAAKKDFERLQLQQKNAVSALQKEYETAVNEYHTAKKSLDYYRYSGIRQAEEIARISQLAYENGEIGYVEYVQNLQSAVEIRLQAAEATNEYNQSVIKIMNYEL